MRNNRWTSWIQGTTANQGHVGPTLACPLDAFIGRMLSPGVCVACWGEAPLWGKRGCWGHRGGEQCRFGVSGCLSTLRSPLFTP